MNLANPTKERQKRSYSRTYQEELPVDENSTAVWFPIAPTNNTHRYKPEQEWLSPEQREESIMTMASESNHNISMKMAKKYVSELYTDEELNQILTERGVELTIPLAMELCALRSEE